MTSCAKACSHAHEQVLRNKRLVTIHTDLDLRYDADACRLRDYDQDDVVTLFNELEFRSLIKELPPSDRDHGRDDTPTCQCRLLPARWAIALFPESAVGAAGSAAASNYLCVQDEARSRPVDALATGTSHLLRRGDHQPGCHAGRAGGAGHCLGPRQAAYIPSRPRDGSQLPGRRACRPAARSSPKPALPKLAHNGKYDLTVCRRHGLDVAGAIHDTMIMAWLLDPAAGAWV